MPDDLPVYGTALGGSSGGAEFLMNGDAGLYVGRPDKLTGRNDVFALYVQGDSMEPRFFEGELIICETRRPPSVGDFVVVEMKETVDGYRVAYLKRMAGRSGGKLRLEQYKPAKEIELDLDDVHQVVRVLTTHDLVS
jgi:phage repressor protein C with HTH and peptisase S24 domain